MINNRYILFLLSDPRSRIFNREASTIQPSGFLNFDVAKLGWETTENKKMHLQPIFTNHSKTKDYKNHISTRRRGEIKLK